MGDNHVRAEHDEVGACRRGADTFESFENNRLDYAESEHLALMIAFDLDDRGDYDRMLYVDAEPGSSDGYSLYGVMTRSRERDDPDDEFDYGPRKRMDRGHT